MKNILVLYSEVMGYNLGCFRELVKRGYAVYCIHWDERKKTPYLPKNEPNIVFYKRSTFNAEQILSLAQELQPKLILVSGWMDKGYLPVCKKFMGKIPVISGLDNWWKGNLKQHIASVLSFLLVKPYFSHLFVPGKYQYEFAKKLGYTDKNILKGLYTCDDTFFGDISLTSTDKKKSLLYIGRYTEIKGILPFVRSFRELSSSLPDCELHLYGNGNLRADLLALKNDQIFINDFIDPIELKDVFSKATVFCLPSIHEPWGLVIHEAVCAGLPLLVSKNIGACTEFFDEGTNGISFDPTNENSIKKALIEFNNLSTEKLSEYSLKSKEFSKKISTFNWANELLSTLS